MLSRLKSIRIERLPREIRDTLEDWAPILFAVGVALLLYAALEAQLARGICV